MTTTGDTDGSVAGSQGLSRVGHPLLPGPIALAERCYRDAVGRGDPEEIAGARSALRDAITELSERDRQRLATLTGEGHTAEREYLKARAELLATKLQELVGGRRPDMDAGNHAGGPGAPVRPERWRGLLSRPANRAAPVSPRELRHRDDIQGLRAVAVLLVALCHAGIGFLAGGFIGVDVFFVVSGFLITGLLLSEARRRRFVSLADFYMRRARRILPAAMLTLLATEFAAFYLLNVVRAKQALQDSVPSALFGANIHFAAAGTDYFARGQPPSPLQHFWSLAVEEQFYVVWPLLLILVLGLSLRRDALRPDSVRGRRMTRLLVVLGVVIAGSFCWSLVDTARQPTAAYFSTLTRAWELGLGAAAAIVSARLAVGPGRRLALGWGGLVCIIAAAGAYSGGTPFPGVAALLPTVGAAMILTAGAAASRTRGSAGWILSTAPLRYVGDRSYAFYLWHWPVLVLAADRVGHPLSAGTNLLLLAGAFGLSVFTYRVYERPIRFAQWARRPPALLPLVGSAVAVVVVSTVLVASITNREDAQLLKSEAFTPSALSFAVAPVAAREASGSHVAASNASTAISELLPAVGAEVSAEARRRRMPAVLVPAVSDLLNDHVNLPTQCTAHDTQTAHSICRMGVASSARTMVIMGDSHAEMWMPAVLALARQEGLAVVPVMKSGCSPPDWTGSVGTGDCHAWFRWATSQIAALRPQTTLIAGYYSYLGPNDAKLLTNGLDAAITQLRKRSGRLVIIGDVPERDREPVDCLLRSGATPGGCSDNLNPIQSILTGIVGRVAQYDRIGFVDTTGWFCAQDRCPLVIGNLIAYRDSDHVSQTYATALSGAFRAAVSLASKPGRHV
jgi:peptidoglycan/LPS O-acetylase OafA/YrhL